MVNAFTQGVKTGAILMIKISPERAQERPGRPVNKHGPFKDRGVRTCALAAFNLVSFCFVFFDRSIEKPNELQMHDSCMHDQLADQWGPSFKTWPAFNFRERRKKVLDPTYLPTNNKNSIWTRSNVQLQNNVRSTVTES